MKPAELTGKKFGRLTVVARAPNKPNVPNSIWLCRCSCGAVKTIRADVLKRGGTLSCGCFRRENASRQMRTHGMSKTPEFVAWHSMRCRCYSVNHPTYRNHGARGIKVCDRWRDSFENFYRDMGPRPSKKHSLDRIDNNGDYTPKNCRWASTHTQSRNTRYNRMVEMDGVSFCVADWCKLLDVQPHKPYDMIYWNKRSGIKTIEEALRVLYDEWKQANS